MIRLDIGQCRWDLYLKHRAVMLISSSISAYGRNQLRLLELIRVQQMEPRESKFCHCVVRDDP